MFNYICLTYTTNTIGIKTHWKHKKNVNIGTMVYCKWSAHVDCTVGVQHSYNPICIGLMRAIYLCSISNFPIINNVYGTQKCPPSYSINPMCIIIS